MTEFGIIVPVAPLTVTPEDRDLVLAFIDDELEECLDGAYESMMKHNEDLAAFIAATCKKTYQIYEEAGITEQAQGDNEALWMGACAGYLALSLAWKRAPVLAIPEGVLIIEEYRDTSPEFSHSTPWNAYLPGDRNLTTIINAIEATTAQTPSTAHALQAGAGIVSFHLNYSTIRSN